MEKLIALRTLLREFRLTVIAAFARMRKVPHRRPLSPLLHRLQRFCKAVLISVLLCVSVKIDVIQLLRPCHTPPAVHAAGK